MRAITIPYDMIHVRMYAQEQRADEGQRLERAENTIIFFIAIA